MLQLAFVNFRKGSYLVVEGKAESDRFYIIQSGHVKCWSSNMTASASNQLLGPGDFVGVIPCMSGHSQIENVIALTDVAAISVRRDQYPELIARNTPVAMKIIRTFANNMREMNERLTQLTLKDSVIGSPEQIFDVASYYEKMNKPSIAIYAYYQYLKACPDGINAAKAKERFIVLKPKSRAVYFESTPDLMRLYPKDTMIFSECQRGAEMFIIQDGKVKITKVVKGEEVTLAVLKKGDMFGEMAMLENKPRSASAVADEECRLMTVNRHNFDQMVATQSQLIARLTTTLAERLWSMCRQLANAQISDPLYKLLDMLALQVEKAKISLKANTSYVTDLTLHDLANMCGIPQEEQASCLYKLQIDPHIKMQGMKITIPDCLELIKNVSFYRRQKR
ncbi:cyclic nucleotide-binding domain-containing protein [Treponema parvum]|uniref:Cyclic nucleotide-binding domain-containing protein n=1 Tax=Treponema parvum TaxID=138851 RepID=A0A975IC06_9SPIR|nr:cyclic nucleotide-binding domain-containing protein [Treponema parvum]QTQ11262.1 cyclic nucleotide-binding domain-containing protein [Treponema parvum]